MYAILHPALAQTMDYERQSERERGKETDRQTEKITLDY